MKELGFKRSTKQREVILKTLQSLRTHPTADEVCKIVKKKLPNISLGTVYRNLEALAASGVIKILDFGPKKRFDGFTDPHVHFCCVLCGKLDDLEIDVTKFAEKEAESKGYVIKESFVELRGVCPNCKNRKES